MIILALNGMMTNISCHICEPFSQCWFVDVGVVETALFLFIGDWSSRICFFNTLTTILLNYWISPIFEDYFFLSGRKISGLRANFFCWSSILNIGLDQFGPILFINASPLCFCCLRSQAGCCRDQYNWSNGDLGKVFYCLVVCGWFFLYLLTIDAALWCPHRLNGGLLG